MNRSQNEAERRADYNYALLTSRAHRSPAQQRTPFVLVHGAWWGAWSFERLIPLLARPRPRRHRARPVGTRPQCAFSDAYAQRPLDEAAFATEPSPSAHITLDDRPLPKSSRANRIPNECIDSKNEIASLRLVTAAVSVISKQSL